MPNITFTAFALAPAPGNIVNVTYTYVLVCTAPECKIGDQITLSVGFTGIDLIRDDNLARGLDPHVVPCRCDEKECVGLPITNTRTFIVGTSLLNEDFGRDEIQLNLTATNTAGASVTANSGVLVGNF